MIAAAVNSKLGTSYYSRSQVIVVPGEAQDNDSDQEITQQPVIMHYKQKPNE